MSTWFIGIACGFFALLGLMLWSRAVDDGMSVFGFGLFGFGVFMIFWLIKRSCDAADERARAARILAAQ